MYSYVAEPKYALKLCLMMCNKCGMY